jgi:hypothetical protein
MENLTFDSNEESWADHSELLRDKYDIHHVELAQIYAMVADFIRRNDRILVGGMAIDYALRAVKSKLYSLDKIDYDFITPEFHLDAYNLGNAIAEKFTDISVICAKHMGTMRVRYKFMAVADITYVPKVLFDKIKTINYEGFKIIHPWFQQIDQFRAMRNMLEEPPMEPLLSDRIQKDVKRFKLLHGKYPFDKITKPKLTEKKIPIYKDKVLTGFAAGMYWLNKVDSKGSQLTNHILIDMYDDSVDYLINKADSLNVGATSDTHSDQSTNYNQLLDKLYPRIVIGNITYHDIHGDKFPVIDLNGSGYIDNLFGAAVILAVRWLFDNDESSGWLYCELAKKFGLDIRPYLPGFDHIFGSQIISGIQYLTAKKKENPAGINYLLPKNAYPEKGKPVIHQFDLSKSEILQIDGQAV